MAVWTWGEIIDAGERHVPDRRPREEQSGFYQVCSVCRNSVRPYEPHWRRHGRVVCTTCETKRESVA